MPLCAFALLATACVLHAATRAQTAVPQGRPVVLLDIKGAIGPATTEYLRNGLAAASDRHAAAVVIRIDTPGGLVSSTRDIIRTMLASPIPVLTYVAPSGARAASAGTYLVYASHLAAMAPGTNIGAATVVNMGGPSPEEDKPASPDDKEDGPATRNGGPRSKERASDASMRKAINDAAAFIRSLADLHGRNAQWADDAVRNGVSIPANEALEKKVVEIQAHSVDDLLAQADGRQVKMDGKSVTLVTKGATVIAMEPDWRARFLGVITEPNIAYVLMLLGIYGIIFELVTPGAIFPGVLGAVALVTALFALNLLPVSYAGIGLVVLGVALMVAEAFTPTLGVLGIAGVAIFGLGSLFMFDGSQPGLTLSIPVIVTATIAMGILLALMLTVALRAHRRKLVSGESTLIGHTGKVLAWSGGQGRVQINGESWHAQSSIAFTPGDGVRIIARDGLTLTVGAAGNEENPS